MSLGEHPRQEARGAEGAAGRAGAAGGAGGGGVVRRARVRQARRTHTPRPALPRARQVPADGRAHQDEGNTDILHNLTGVGMIFHNPKKYTKSGFFFNQIYPI